jgi:hypothetical protein
MSELWMDSDKGKELLSDIEPEGLDEACSMVYNLHEDALCLKQERDQLKQQLADAVAMGLSLSRQPVHVGVDWSKEHTADHDAKVIEDAQALRDKDLNK